MSFDPPDRSGVTLSSPHTACVGIGSNLEPDRHLPAAVEALRRSSDVKAASNAWQSHAVGINSPDFVNAALLVQTTLGRAELTALLKRIERQLGRTHAGRAELVSVDLDLLVYDGMILKEDLWDLAYRAVPVAELRPDLICPNSGERLSLASARLAVAGAIWPRPDIHLDATRPRTSRAGAAESS